MVRLTWTDSAPLQRSSMWAGKDAIYSHKSAMLEGMHCSILETECLQMLLNARCLNYVPPSGLPRAVTLKAHSQSIC